jgi:serine/threonine protein kinase
MSETPDLPTQSLRPPNGPRGEAPDVGTQPPSPEPEKLEWCWDQLPTPFKPATVENPLGWLGSYRLLGVLGRGGMGVVYRAHDPQLGRDVAVKALLPELAALPEARSRFLREARAVASLKHDNIVVVHQVGEADGVPYLVMELLCGMSLAEWLERGGKPTVAQVLRVGRDVARGLEAAHRRGLVHRDIKPANLWLEQVSTSTFRVKILDFGLARPIAATDLTQQGLILGTPRFIAPEQAAGQPIDRRADLFSLGCVLYRLCTGRLAFPSTKRSDAPPSATWSAPPPILDLEPATPPALARLIMRLLAYNPADRPASAREVEEELRSIARTHASGPEERGADRRPRRSPLLERRGLLILAGVLLAGAGLLTITLIGPSRRKPVEDPPQQTAEPTATRPPQLTFQGASLHHTNEIRSLAWSANGRFLATGSFDQTAALQDTSTRQVVARLPDHNGVVESVAFSPDDSYLVTASSDGRLRWWSVPDGKLLGARRAHKGGANGVAFGRTARGETVLVSCGVDHRLRLWSRTVGESSGELIGHKDRVDTVAVSPDGTRIASGSCDRTVRIWDVAARNQVAELAGYQDRVSCVVFSPDGKRVATADADERSARVWDLDRPARPVWRFTHKGNVHGVAFSPDGRFLATAAQRDGGVVLWDLAAGKRIDLPPRQADYTWAVAFAPTGDRLAAGDYAFLKVWKVQR